MVTAGADDAEGSGELASGVLGSPPLGATIADVLRGVLGSLLELVLALEVLASTAAELIA